jgi:hypothetical protein
MAVGKMVCIFFCVSNLPVLSELPSYFHILFSEKKTLTVLRANSSDRIPGAFNPYPANVEKMVSS